MTESAQAPREAAALLADGLVHKLRNSLNAMRAHLAVAQKQACVAPHKLPSQLEKLERTILEAENVLGDIDTLTHPHGDERQEVDVRVLVREVVAETAPQLTAGRIRIEDRLDVELPAVKLPVRQVKQAILRLVTNAREAMPEGGTLTLAACPERDCVVVEVGDSGCGIDELDRQRVFEPFFSRKPGRVGLSLAVVRQTVEALGGSIEFNSEPGQGSIFRLILPAAGARKRAERAAPDFTSTGPGVAVHGE